MKDIFATTKPQAILAARPTGGGGPDVDWLPNPPTEGPCIKITVFSGDGFSVENGDKDVPMITGIGGIGATAFGVTTVGPVVISGGNYAARMSVTRPYMKPFDDLDGNGFPIGGPRADGTGLWLTEGTVLNVSNAACTQRIGVALSAEFDMATNWFAGSGLILGGDPSPAWTVIYTVGTDLSAGTGFSAGDIISANAGVYWVQARLAFRVH